MIILSVAVSVHFDEGTEKRDRIVFKGLMPDFKPGRHPFIQFLQDSGRSVNPAEEKRHDSCGGKRDHRSEGDYFLSCSKETIRTRHKARSAPHHFFAQIHDSEESCSDQDASRVNPSAGVTEKNQRHRCKYQIFEPAELFPPQIKIHEAGEEKPGSAVGGVDEAEGVLRIGQRPLVIPFHLEIPDQAESGGRERQDDVHDRHHKPDLQNFPAVKPPCPVNGDHDHERSEEGALVIRKPGNSDTEDKEQNFPKLPGVKKKHF